jgi:hypothetical protein
MASKITIKRSLTAAAPAGLSFGELAFVQGSGLTANQLYVGISGGSPVWVGAQISTTGTWTDNAAKTSLATQYAIDQRIALFSGLTSGGPLGTPSSGTLTNCTNLPVSTGISGLGTNVAAFLATPSSANLASALTDETGSSVVVFGTSPAITTSLTTPSTSFDLLNTTATTVNFAGGASSALNIGNVGGTATFAGSVIVNGDFTVQGNTTTLNTTTLNVEDFNITMGLTLTSASQCTGAGIGIGVGTGITFAYDHSSLGWLSSVNMDLASGKVFKIANASVLSATTLGSAVVTSSLTTVGIITSGTWSGSFGAVSGANLTNLTAGNLSGTIPSGVLANSTVNIGTTAVALNRASASLALTGISIDGNAGTATTATTAGTVTTAAQPNITSVGTLSALTVSATITGSVSGSAATVTGAAQSAITSVGTLTSLTVSGTLEAGLIDAGTF